MKKQDFLKGRWTVIVLILLLSLLASSLVTGCQKESTTTKLEDEQSQTQETQESQGSQGKGYIVVDTGQEACFDNKEEIECPDEGSAFYGQDAQNQGTQPSYKNNGDGTVTDINTGLMWQQDPGDKMTYDDAVSGADDFELAGYDDWRLPTVKELYSLILFSGTDPKVDDEDASGLTPFIDTDYFDFEYGDTGAGERIIDSQWATSTLYVSTVMSGQQAMFGVNFADGRIKGYPTKGGPGGVDKTYYVRYVRGNTDYGKNNFKDNGDGTISDSATSLMWSKADSGEGMNWKDALAWVEQKNKEDYLGHNDWRLPNAKELQSIVDYSRSPDTTNSATIDPIFEISSITDEGGEKDFPFFWTSTTHVSSDARGDTAVYISFGEGLGWMGSQSDTGGQQPPGPGNQMPSDSEDRKLLDVHGAGSQRSDPKTGDADDFPYGRGPQGDVIRINNYVRCVRDI